MAMVPNKSEKPAAQSRTVQLNIIFGVAATVAAIDPSLFAVLGPKGIAVGAVLVAAANLILRFRPS